MVEGVDAAGISFLSWMLLLRAFLIYRVCRLGYTPISWHKMIYSVWLFRGKLLPREVANIKIQRAGARVSEFCIELHPAADLGVRRIEIPFIPLREVALRELQMRNLFDLP